MTNKSLKDKLLSTAKKDTTWREKAQERMRNEKWQDLSFTIATRILAILKEKGITQIELSERLDVSPQMVNKIVKGKENLTLETIARLGEVLSTDLIEVPSLSIKIPRTNVSVGSRMSVIVCSSYKQTQNVSNLSFMYAEESQYACALQA